MIYPTCSYHQDPAQYVEDNCSHHTQLKKEKLLIDHFNLHYLLAGVEEDTVEEDVTDDEIVVEVVNVVDKVVDTVDEAGYAVLIWLSRYSICSSLLSINFTN